MADSFVFDLDTDYPDVIVDTVRGYLKQAVADLEAHAGQLDDSFLLGLTAFDFAQTVLVNFTALQNAFTEKQAQLGLLAEQLAEQANQLAALTGQVAALQAPTTPPEVP